jgi:hypothetical protein
MLVLALQFSRDRPIARQVRVEDDACQREDDRNEGAELPHNGTVNVGRLGLRWCCPTLPREEGDRVGGDPNRRITSDRRRSSRGRETSESVRSLERR